MALDRMIEAQPQTEPQEAQQSRGQKRDTPRERVRHEGDKRRSDEAADARSAVKNGDRDSALAGGKPFGDRLAGPGPVAALTHPEEEAEQGE